MEEFKSFCLLFHYSPPPHTHSDGEHVKWWNGELTLCLCPSTTYKPSFLNNYICMWVYMYLDIYKPLYTGSGSKTLNFFFSLISPIFDKNAIKLIFFTISSIIQSLSFSIKILHNINEQEKKRQRICNLLNIGTKPKFLVYLIQSKEKQFLQKKSVL